MREIKTFWGTGTFIIFYIQQKPLYRICLRWMTQWKIHFLVDFEPRNSPHGIFFLSGVLVHFEGFFEKRSQFPPINALELAGLVFCEWNIQNVQCRCPVHNNGREHRQEGPSFSDWNGRCCRQTPQRSALQLFRPEKEYAIPEGWSGWLCIPRQADIQQWLGSARNCRGGV